MPGHRAALVSSFFSICWVCMLKLGACEFSCTCLELIQHRLGFEFSLPDQFSSFTHRFPFSHTPLATLKQFLLKPFVLHAGVFPPSPPSSAVCTGGVGCGVVLRKKDQTCARGKLCALSVSGIQMGRYFLPLVKCRKEGM